MTLVHGWFTSLEPSDVLGLWGRVSTVKRERETHEQAHGEANIDSSACVLSLVLKMKWLEEQGWKKEVWVCRKRSS